MNNLFNILTGPGVVRKMVLLSCWGRSILQQAVSFHSICQEDGKGSCLQPLRLSLRQPLKIELWVDLKTTCEVYLNRRLFAKASASFSDKWFSAVRFMEEDKRKEVLVEVELKELEEEKSYEE